MEFRETTKEKLQILIPEEIHEELRIRTAKANRPANEVISAILCRGLDMDPERFGLSPELHLGRRPKAMSAASA